MMRSVCRHWNDVHIATYSSEIATLYAERADTIRRGALVSMAAQGLFAFATWIGVLSFWLAAGVFFAWTVFMAIALVGAISQQAATEG